MKRANADDDEIRAGVGGRHQVRFEVEDHGSFQLRFSFHLPFLRLTLLWLATSPNAMHMKHLLVDTTEPSLPLTSHVRFIFTISILSLS